MSIYELSPGLLGLRILAVVAAALTLAGGAHAAWSVPPVSAPQFGTLGKRRALARNHDGFVLLEPLVSRTAGWLACLPMGSLRRVLTRLATRAGDPAGLSADEWVALSVWSFLTVGVGGAKLVEGAGFASAWVGLVLLLGLGLPVARVHALAKERAKQLERSLPSAMDLCVLCMGAGSDFHAALSFVVRDLGAAHEVCREELVRVLDELGLGRTRVQALSALGERTGSRAVRDFVAAICQSETKGTPLVEALSIQAGTLRQRRSVLAEEAAAKASVRLMFPLMLMVGCLMLLVFGPFIVTGMGM
jgi:tight adherence protein C